MQASASGFQMFRLAQLRLMYELTDSLLFVGALGIAGALSPTIFILIGGVLADKLDKRRLIIATEASTATFIFVLATLTLMERVTAWHLFTFAALISATQALGQPARHAFYPSLIDRRAIMSAVVLVNSFLLASRFASAISGLIIASADTAVVFYLAGLGFLIMAGFMLRLQSSPVYHGSAGIVEGLRFLRREFTFSYLIVLSLVSGLFGMSYFFLLPIFAVDILGVGAGGAGWLLFGVSGGGVAVNLALAYSNTIRRQGQLVVVGALLFGLMVAVFALTSTFVGSFVFALGVLIAIGMFETIHLVGIQSSIQSMVPDHVRGRVLSFYFTASTLQPLGGMQAGALANFVGAPFAVAFGGLMVSAFVGWSVLKSDTVRRLASVRAQTA